MTTISEAITNYGYDTPKNIVMDGKLHRFATDASKAHSRDGWYILFDDASGNAGAFGSWRDGSSIVWSNGTGRKLSQVELADIEAKRRAGFELAKKTKNDAAHRAQRLYDVALESGTSGYLLKKGIEQPAGTRYLTNIVSSAFGFNSDRLISALIVPIYAPSGVMATLQIIMDDGNKLFMRDGSTTGGWFALGDWKASRCVVIAEGLATAQSIYQASGIPVMVAFSAHNLRQVAMMARAKNATAEILIAVDGDKAGRDNSSDAAKAVNGRMIEAADGMDWNDAHQAEGLQAVRSSFVTEEINTLWKADLIVKNKSDGTQTIPCRAHNLILILSNETEFNGRIKFNELTGNVNIDGRELNDPDLTVIKASLEKNHIDEKIPNCDIYDAVLSVAQSNKYNPIRGYLNGLKWDGGRRVHGLFFEYFGADSSDYTMAVSRSFLVSAVARVMDPGCQVDTMVILEGAQGSKKSSALSMLFSNNWHSEVSASITDKDFFQNLRGKWILEFGEMTHITRADSNHIKQVLTIRADNYRESYGRLSKSYPRQSIFAGTTNDDRYLKDATGARRYLPVKTVYINLDAIKRDRDQLWAEAVHMYKNGANWWDIPDAEAEQEKRYEVDSWEELIEQWLIDNKIRSVALHEVMFCALGIEKAKQSRVEQMRVSAALKRLNWERVYATINGARKWMYCLKKT